MKLDAVDLVLIALAISLWACVCLLVWWSNQAKADTPPRLHLMHNGQSCNFYLLRGMDYNSTTNVWVANLKQPSDKCP